jgi:phenylacetate-CoA ligase
MIDRPAWPALGDWSTFEQLHELQVSARPRALAMASGSPFYANRFAGGETTLAGFGLTTKADLRAGYPFGFLAVPEDRVATYHESSGTSGEPTASYLTERDWAECADRFNRSSVALGASDRVLVKTPYSMATTAHQMHVAARAAGAMVIPASNRTSMMPYGRVLRLLRDLQPTVTWSLPSEPLVWAAADRFLAAGTREKVARLRALVVAGEPLSAAKRRRIGELWDARVIEDYGSTETTSLAGECPRGVLHAWADRFLLEVRDLDSGALRPTGVGSLVVTTLYREAMPLVRYDTEDVVELAEEPCACGWVLPRIRVLGRAGSAIHAAGRALRQTELDDLVYGLPAHLGVLFWEGVAAADRLELRVEVAADLAEEAVTRLGEEARSVLGIPVEVRAVEEGMLMPVQLLGKESPFVKPRFLFAEHENLDIWRAYQD